MVCVRPGAFAASSMACRSEPGPLSRLLVTWEVTVTVAVPLTLPLFALTVAEPVPEAEALYRPLLLTEPGPVDVQVKVGWVAIGLPNWSSAMALNCCVPPSATLTEVGVTTIEVSVWLTVTLTSELVMLSPSRIGDGHLERVRARLGEGGCGFIVTDKAVAGGVNEPCLGLRQPNLGEGDGSRGRADGRPGIGKIQIAVITLDPIII